MPSGTFPRSLTRHRHLVIGGVAVSAVLTATVLATAQDGGLDIGGFRQSFSISQTLRYNDNPRFSAAGSDASVTSRTALSYGLTSQTRSQRLSFGLSGAVEAGGDDDDTFELIAPQFSMNYAIQNRNSRIATSLSYQVDELDDFTFTLPVPDPVVVDDGTGLPVIDPLDPVDTDVIDPLIDDEVIISDGRREEINGSFSFDTGRAAPFGFGATLTLRERNFRDVGDATLSDRSEIGLALRSRYRITPTLNANLGARTSVSETDDAENTKRRASSVSLGATYLIRPGLSTNASLSYTETRTERLSGDSKTDGGGLSVGLTQALPSGSIGVSASTQITTNGRRSSLQLSRSLTLRDGSLGFSLGLSKSEGESIQPTGSINYSRNLRTGSVGLTFSQSLGINNDDNNVVNTRLSARYSQRVNNNSSWNATLSLADTNVTGDGTDQQRIDAGLSYRYGLGSDWDLVTGYNHSRANRSDEPQNRVSNRVSLTISRSFGR